MTAALPRTAREVRLTAVPEGLPAPDDFTVAAAPLPEPGPGRVLVRNRYFLVFPGLRTLMGTEAGGLPLPPIRTGDALYGPAVAEVVAAGPGGPLRPGATVTHLRGWCDYAVLDAAECRPVADALPDPVAYLNQGLAAYGSLTRVAPVRTHDTVLVTGAAGAVGTLAGQIARLLGAGRVIGTTRSAAKAGRLRAESGYDEVVVAGDAPFAERLAEAAPEGVDVVLDMVGGEQLTAAVGAARPGGRLALVGALSGQLAPGRAGGSAPAEIDAFRVVTRGLTLRGYLSDDHAGVVEEWEARLGRWLRAGGITFPYTRIPGIERAPRALRELMAGAYFGAVIVEVASG